MSNYDAFAALIFNSLSKPYEFLLIEFYSKVFSVWRIVGVVCTFTKGFNIWGFRFLSTDGL
jgi:hypothetical protein